MTSTAVDLIDNTAWLRGYDRYLAGESCPWTVNGDQSARLGWIAARDEAEASVDFQSAAERADRYAMGRLA